MDFVARKERKFDDLDKIEDYLLAKCDTGDPGEITYALRIMARGAGIDSLSRRIGLPRQVLLSALSDINPVGLMTASKVADMLGFRLNLVRKRPRT